MTAEDFGDGRHPCRFCGVSVEVVKAELVFRHPEPVCPEFQAALDEYLPSMLIERFMEHLEKGKRELAEWDRKHLRKKAVCPRRPGGH